MKTSNFDQFPFKLMRVCSKHLFAFLLTMVFLIPVSASSLTFCPLEVDICPLEGDIECDEVCNIIGVNASSETDISEVDDGWFASCIRVRGKLFIDENTNLGNAQFIMDPGSEIVVMGGVRLFLFSSQLMAGCEELWRGIRVEDGGALYFYYSKISGANAGIYLGNRCTLTAWYSVFENNYIGIATAMPYDESSDPKAMNASLIFGCDFINTDVLRTPYSGHHYDPNWPTDANIPYDRDFAGIYLRNTQGLNVGLDSELQSGRNAFDGLRNGIVIDEVSTVDIGYCDISNLVGTTTSNTMVDPIEDITSSGVYVRNSVARVHDNIMDQLHDGVVVMLSNAEVFVNDVTLKMLTPVVSRASTRGISVVSSMERVSIHDNLIQEGNVGIYVEGGATSVLEIEDNVIESETEDAASFGIQINHWKILEGGAGLIRGNEINITDAFVAIGIDLLNAVGLTVFNNEVTFIRENENNAKFSAGLKINGCANLSISQNDLEGEGDYATTYHYGIFYENSQVNKFICNDVSEFSKAFVGSGLCNLTKLMKSEFDLTNPEGLELRAPTRLDRQEHHWNHWGGNTHSVAGAYISGPDPELTAQNSEFIVEDDNMCVSLPCPIGPLAVSTGWFQNADGPEEIACVLIDPDPVTPTDDDLEDALLHPGEFEDFDEEMIWMMKSWIFKAILDDPGLLLNARLDSFYHADDGEPLGILTLVNEKIHRQPDEASSLYSLGLEILDSLDIVTWIDDELKALSPDSNALRVRRDNAVDTLLLLQDDRSTLISAANADRATAMGLAATALGSLTTYTDFEEFYKRALLYKLEYLSSGLTGFSGGDWEEIQEIATLCTWEGGKAASLARSLCSSARDSIVAPEVICTGINPRNSSPEFSDLINGLYVYPNPSVNGWNAMLPAGSRTLRVVNVSGQSIMNREVTGATDFIETESLSPGIYFSVRREQMAGY